MRIINFAFFLVILQGGSSTEQSCPDLLLISKQKGVCKPPRHVLAAVSVFLGCLAMSSRHYQKSLRFQVHAIRTRKMTGSVFGRTDFSRIFIFGPPDFFADFLAGFFLLIFVGKSAQKNPPGKSPAKSSKICTTKIPDTFLQRVRPKKNDRTEKWFREIF